MKLGLQNYAVFTPIKYSNIKFNKNKINSLQIYDIAQNYKIIHKVVQCLSQYHANLFPNTFK
jgi:hypothetical protein